MSNDGEKASGYREQRPWAARIKKEQGQEASLLSRRSPQFLPYHLSTLFPQIAHIQLLATLAGLSYFADHREDMLTPFAEIY